ncbi:uncharacterized protein LOC107486073 [Arachis duranensis]|uniref:Uncharacterized protein LOC107486073 n=1 Tax=Arachis duranensis TaxID=130453 RepID=A0A6P4D6I3_ARADU|nr:uncharacterized protein LOC107486073 [Arachis duranensis]
MAFVSNGIGLIKMDNGVEREEEQGMQSHKNSSETISPAEVEIQVCNPSDEEPAGNNNTMLKEKSNSILFRMIILLLMELYQRYRYEVLKEGFINGANKKKQQEGVDDHQKLIFRSHVYQKVIAIPSALRLALLTYCAMFLRDVVNQLAPFQVQYRGNSQHLLLSCSEAFFMFFPEIAQITIFAICCVVLILLVLPLHIELQIFIVMFLVVPASLSYFPEMGRRASGVHVECATFKASLIRFVILFALGFSLILGLVILAALYISWRKIFERRGPGRKKKQENVKLGDLLEAVA